MGCGRSPTVPPAATEGLLMALAKILVQLDTDPQPCVFDAVVAIDAGAEQLLRHGGVTAQNVRPFIYGGMFTRSPADLKSTAIFIGGSNVPAAEAVLAEVRKTYFGPLRMSVLWDASGANTTAAAAVLSAARHLDLPTTTALVLGGTGPVGSRVARLLLRAGATVRLGSRDRVRAEAACGAIAEQIATSPGTASPELAERAVPGLGARLAPVATASAAEMKAALDGVSLIIAAGSAGSELLSTEVRRTAAALRVMIDLNAVPPAGIAGVEPTDKAQDRDGVVAYGALGVGGLKMKIHKRAIAKLFESNDQILDAEEVFAIGRELVG